MVSAREPPGCASPADALIPPSVLSRGRSCSGPAAAEAQRRLRSNSSQRDLSAEVETGASFPLPSSDRFSA